MALRMIESFDHYPTAMIQRKWTGQSSNAPAISAGNGRRGSAALRCNLTTHGVFKLFDSQATWIVGIALRILDWPGNPSQIVTLRDGGTIQVDVRLNTNGTFSVTRNGTTLSTSTYAMPISSYVYLEFKATIDDATGSYELRINGSTITSGSGVDTKNTANASADRVYLALATSTASAPDIYIDDVYICDGSGSVNNDFLGDCRVDACFPNGNGNSSQFVGSDGNSTDNYALVDEASMNSDTDYVESSTVSDKDTYAVSNLSHSPTDIFGIQINLFAKKSDAGIRSIQPVIRSGGADTDGTARVLSTDYTDETEVFEADPDTAAAWTESGFNSAEFGAKVAA